MNIVHSDEFQHAEDKSNCIGVCEVLLQKMLPYIASVDTIDSIFLEEKIPSLAEYWQRRDLTAAVYPVIGTLAYVLLQGSFIHLLFTFKPITELIGT